MKATKTFKLTIACRAAIVLTAGLLAICGYKAKATATKPREADTSRRNVVLIQGDGVRNTDSMEYVIDGKKSTQEKFEKLSPENILSVNWVSAENAEKIFENNGRNILFVTTRNSEEGKKMLVKVNTVKNNKGQVFSTKKSGVYEITDGSLQEVTPGDDGVVMVTGYDKAYTSKNPMLITARGKSITGSINHTHVYKTVPGTVYNYATSNSKTYKTAKGKGDVITVTGYQLKPETELSNLEDKLIVINDKEATTADLKKISAFDIDKMSFKNDDYTRDQYGEKAKNGVVYIYTKK